jgi:hypothetical protein
MRVSDMSGVSEERKREIRQQEIEYACRDIATTLGIDPDGLSDKIAWVFWEHDALVRQRWASRDFTATMRACWDEWDKEERDANRREAKLQRLIDHPSTPASEREAARLALGRIT